MKNKFLILLSLLLILIPISYSIDNFATSQSIDQYINQYTITQLVKIQYENLKVKRLPEESIKGIKIALPISLKLNISDTNETIFLEITKNGEILMPESMPKTDFEIITTRAKFLDLFKSNKSKAPDLKSLIENESISIKTYSLKAEIFIQVIEDKLNLKIVKNKGFRANTIGFIAGKFIGMFIPSQQ